MVRLKEIMQNYYLSRFTVNDTSRQKGYVFEIENWQ